MSARLASVTTADRDDDRHGEAAEFWSRRAGRPISPESARVITENLTGFFSLLREWQVKEAEGASSTVCATHDAGGPR
jgi:hypothetical protein